MAGRHPKRIGRLAALSSPMQALRTPERLRMHFLVGIFRLTGWRAWLLEAVANALVLRPEAKPYVKEAAQRPGPARTRLAMRSVSFNRPSLVERLEALEAPTLFVTAPADALWPPELARAHAARLRNGRIEILDGVRHVPPVEAPDATADLLCGWLAG
jgi:pimeloyl-ACP methyl ester carboxylesterase